VHYPTVRLCSYVPEVNGNGMSSTGPSAREVRQWARDSGYEVGERGRLNPAVVRAWNETFPDRPFSSHPPGGRRFSPPTIESGAHEVGPVSEKKS
jgi:hypothetical protein